MAVYYFVSLVSKDDSDGETRLAGCQSIESLREASEKRHSDRFMLVSRVFIVKYCHPLEESQKILAVIDEEFGRG